jgi:hypothetical protein
MCVSLREREADRDQNQKSKFQKIENRKIEKIKNQNPKFQKSKFANDFSQSVGCDPADLKASRPPSAKFARPYRDAITSLMSIQSV